MYFSEEKQYALSEVQDAALAVNGAPVERAVWFLIEHGEAIDDCFKKVPQGPANKKLIEELRMAMEEIKEWLGDEQEEDFG